jgi:hypothetical protein
VKKFLHRLIFIAFLILSAFLILNHNGCFRRTPNTTSITIFEPANNSSVNTATTTVKGKINPVNARLIINDYRIKTNDKGEFVYDWALPNEKNTIILTVIAPLDGDDKTQVTWNINRIITDEEKKKIAEQKQALQDANLKKELTAFIESLKKFDTSKKDSVDVIMIEVTLFDRTVAPKIVQAAASANPEIKQLGKQLEGVLSQVQIREFPLMRKAYGKIVNDQMWIEDGKASVYGNGNKTIELVSVVFAANKNIAELYSSTEVTLKKLRFNRVNFKWYSGASEYNYYDIDSLKDSAIKGVTK